MKVIKNDCLLLLYPKIKTGNTDLFNWSVYSMETVTFKGKNKLSVIKYYNLAVCFKNEVNFINWRTNKSIFYNKKTLWPLFMDGLQLPQG